jgi:hypothetical protein
MNTHKKRLTIVMFLVFLVSALSANSQLGCCTNPGSPDACSEGDWVSLDAVCCPQPENQNSQYYKDQVFNPNGPLDYSDCSSNFFYEETSCGSSAITECVQGCCCTSQGGTQTGQAQCQESGAVFTPGQLCENAGCIDPECNDGIDNDGNGCADYSEGDTGCFASEDSTESGGQCLTDGIFCSDPSYTPIIEIFDAFPVNGKKEFTLVWSSECEDNIQYYEVSRCEGAGCSNFALVTSSTSNTFIDSSSELEFEKVYNYQLKAVYTIQSPSYGYAAATLGNSACQDKPLGQVFCLGNAAFFCNTKNVLKPQGTACSSDQVCTVKNNNPECVQMSECQTDVGNPFGIFFTKLTCENQGYCFYDRSRTSVDNCFNCDPSMSCYDYKTITACNQDNCNVKNCRWKDSETALGLGLCVSTKEYNCQWCDKSGTPSLSNINSFNPLFEYCTEKKSDYLSVSGYECFYSNGISLNCETAICTDYSKEECSTSQLTLDNTNTIQNPSNDKCSIGKCQRIGNQCVKNADGDNSPDCDDSECEKDYFEPSTILIPVLKNQIIDGIFIQVYDRTSFNSSELLRSSNEYETYLCLDDCETGHPFSVSTFGKSLVVSNLNLFDRSNGRKLLTLSQGENELFYYTKDLSKNLGIVDSIIFSAGETGQGPKVRSVEIEDGIDFSGSIITANTQPDIKINFFEIAAVTLISLKNLETSRQIPINIKLDDGTTSVYSVNQQLESGNYEVKFNAQDESGNMMGSLYSQLFSVDNTVPALQITPDEGTTIRETSTTITLTFSKNVNLDQATINDESIKDKFTTSDNLVYAAQLSLKDDSYHVFASGSDYLSNNANGARNFIVNAVPINISLSSPRYGVAKDFVFNVTVNTDNAAECRYKLDDNPAFGSMSEFDSTGGSSHIINGFNRIFLGDKSTHKLYVRCNEDFHGEKSSSFNLRVDRSPPVIKNFFISPSPITESPPIGTLAVETDDKSICKYSFSTSIFDDMEGIFYGFEEASFRLINRKNATFPGEGKYNVTVVCKNEAELISNAKSQELNINFTFPLTVISHTSHYFNSSQVFLSVETNKNTLCYYSQDDPQITNGNPFASAGFFHKKTFSLTGGAHTIYVKCVDRAINDYSGVLPISFTVDTSPPAMIYVSDNSTLKDNLEYTCLDDRLRVSFLGKDIESDIKDYSYSLYRRRDGYALINNSKETTEDRFFWVRGLHLDNDTEYYFSVFAQNFGGYNSEIKSSDGITLDPSICEDDSTIVLTCSDRGDCDIGDPCFSNSDCFSRYCLNNTCDEPSCEDGILNRNNETDVDCGKDCPPCALVKKCIENSDCLSGLCSFGTCKPQEVNSCFDKIFSEDESDVDCGGICQKGCPIGRSCNVDEDCIAGLDCVSSICTRVIDPVIQQPKDTSQDDGDGDMDRDGILDSWEIENDMDPKDPSDANADFDGDGLSNLDEYNMRNYYAKSTDPNNPDTDGDGVSDKEEFDKGTNPLDPDDKPKSGFLKVLLFILVFILLLIGFAYLGYMVMERKKEGKYSSSMKTTNQGFNQMPAFGQQFIRPSAPEKPMQSRMQLRPPLMKKFRDSQKLNERKKLFSSFGEEIKKGPISDAKKTQDQKAGDKAIPIAGSLKPETDKSSAKKSEAKPKTQTKRKYKSKSSSKGETTVSLSTKSKKKGAGKRARSNEDAFKKLKKITKDYNKKTKTAKIKNAKK